MQCFTCQNFDHKDELYYITDSCVKCTGARNTRDSVKDAAQPARFANCGGQHIAIRGAQKHKYTRKGEHHENPSKPQQVWKPNTASRVEFPDLSHRQRVQQPAQDTSAGRMEEF